MEGLTACTGPLCQSRSTVPEHARNPSDFEELPIPPDEIIDTHLHRRRRLIVQILDQIGHIGVSGRDIAGLNGEHVLLDGLAERLFDGVDEVHQFYRIVVADVIDLIWGGRRGRVRLFSTPGCIWTGGIVDYPHNTFYDVVDVSKIAQHFA